MAQDLALAQRHAFALDRLARREFQLFRIRDLDSRFCRGNAVCELHRAALRSQERILQLSQKGLFLRRCELRKKVPHCRIFATFRT